MNFKRALSNAKSLIEIFKPTSLLRKPARVGIALIMGFNSAAFAGNNVESPQLQQRIKEVCEKMNSARDLNDVFEIAPQFFTQNDRERLSNKLPGWKRNFTFLPGSQGFSVLGPDGKSIRVNVINAEEGRITVDGKSLKLDPSDFHIILEKMLGKARPKKAALNFLLGVLIHESKAELTDEILDQFLKEFSASNKAGSSSSGLVVFGLFAGFCILFPIVGIAFNVLADERVDFSSLTALTCPEKSNSNRLMVHLKTGDNLDLRIKEKDSYEGKYYNSHTQKTIQVSSEVPGPMAKVVEGYLKLCNDKEKRERAFQAIGVNTKSTAPSAAPTDATVSHQQ